MLRFTPFTYWNLAFSSVLYTSLMLRLLCQIRGVKYSSLAGIRRSRFSSRLICFAFCVRNVLMAFMDAKKELAAFVMDL